MDIASAAVHHTIVAVDVEKYSSAERTDFDRLAVREGMYAVVSAAFRESDIPWDRCRVDDVGDSLLMLLPSDVPRILTVDRLPHRLTAMLRRYNRTHAASARMRLRMAVHAGEVHHDRDGIAGESVILTCRLLDAKALKEGLAASTGELALVVSDDVYRATVRHDPAAPAFRRIPVDVKETSTHAWMSVESAPAPSAPARRHSSTSKALPLAELTRLVDALEEIPTLHSSDGRDQLMEYLPRELRTGVRRTPTPRTDFVSIVTACWHHPHGLDHLVEAVRLLYPGATLLAEVVAQIGDGSGR